MLTFLRLSVGLLLAAGLSLQATAAPLEAYGKLPTIEAVAISPSGKTLALVVSDGTRRVIVAKDVDTGKITLRAGAGDAKVRSIRWASDDHLVIVSSTTARPFDIQTLQREWLLGLTLNVATGKVLPLLRDAKHAMNTISDVPVVRQFNGKPTLLVEGVKFVDNQGVLALYRVDLASVTSQVVEVGDPDTRNWVIGVDGRPVAEERYDVRTGRWSMKVRDTNGWREVAAQTAILDRPQMAGLGRDGKAVAYVTRDSQGGTVWREVRLDGGQAAAPLTLPGAPNPIRDPQDGRLIGYSGLDGDGDRYSFFEPHDTKIWNAVLKAYPDSRVSLQSWSSDRQRIVVYVDSPSEGPAFALIDLKTRAGTWLGNEYDGVRPDDIAPRNPIRFKARDGLALTGYLTTPRGKPAKGLPLIVFPHGGPAARDTPGFDWWAQGMASRGYAVLQVNFRGSAGLGDQLLQAGYGQWGRKMQTDLSDGVAWLAGEGTIDPKRVCIVGASYGGYAALAGATLDRGVYRCAASYAGPTDLRRMIAWSKARGGQAAFRYWTRFMGAEVGKDPVLEDISPAAQAVKAEIPLLLIHGKDDSVVPLEQSRMMADAMKRAGKSAELVVLPGEDHWLSRGETRLQTLTATMAFVEKHNPPN